MTISVWADVGGTFTDCLLGEGQIHPSGRETKILSSGLVRAGLSQRVDSSTLRLDSLAASQTHGFWVGADVSILDALGNRLSLGRVQQHESTAHGCSPRRFGRREA